MKQQVALRCWARWPIMPLELVCQREGRNHPFPASRSPGPIMACHLVDSRRLKICPRAVPLAWIEKIASPGVVVFRLLATAPARNGLSCNMASELCPTPTPMPVPQQTPIEVRTAQISQRPSKKCRSGYAVKQCEVMNYIANRCNAVLPSGLLDHQRQSHADAAYAYIGAQPFADARGLPEDAQDTILLPIEHAWEYVVHVGARADEEEDDEEEGLEVEEGGHDA